MARTFKSVKEILVAVGVSKLELLQLGSIFRWRWVLWQNTEDQAKDDQRQKTKQG